MITPFVTGETFAGGLDNQAFGAAVAATPPLTIESKSPSTGEFLGSVVCNTPEQVREAVLRARLAAKAWAETSFAERAACIKKANRYILDHFTEIVEVISKENGKPRVEAKLTDLLPVLYTNYYFARHANRILAGHRVSMPLWNLTGKVSEIRHIPWGVIGIIAPWNYPFGIPMTQIAMALMAGNTVVIKPSSSTALTGEKMREVWQAAGLPENVVTVVQGPGRLGEMLIDEPVDKLIFTGSVPIGRHLAILAAEKLLPITLELGGKDPAIVLRDANLETATSGILWGGMANAGQTCAGIERVYVERPVYDKFLQLLVAKAKKLRVGPDHDFNVDMGAITSRSQLELIDRQVRAAVAAGAKIETGGYIMEDKGGSFYAPTILTNVSPDMDVVKEETFGPVLPIIPFDNVEDAIAQANDSRFSLSASIWTGDTRRGREIAKQLIAGTVTVNDALYTYALVETPWGGFGESGNGKTHGREGLLEMVRSIHVGYDRLPGIKKLWWYPYESGLKNAFLSMISALTHRQTGRSLCRAVCQLPWRSKL